MAQLPEKQLKSLIPVIKKAVKFANKLVNINRNFTLQSSQGRESIDLSILISQYLLRLDFNWTITEKLKNSKISKNINFHYKLPSEVTTSQEIPSMFKLPLNLNRVLNEDLVSYLQEVLLNVPVVEEIHNATLARYAERFTVSYLRATDIKNVSNVNSFNTVAKFLTSSVPYSKSILLDDLSILPAVKLDKDSNRIYTVHPFSTLEYYEPNTEQYAKQVPLPFQNCCIPLNVLNLIRDFSEDVSTKDVLCSIVPEPDNNLITFTRLTGWLKIPCEFNLKFNPVIIPWSRQYFTHDFAFYLEEASITSLIEMKDYLAETLDLDPIVEISVEPNNSLIRITPVFTSELLSDTKSLAINLKNRFNRFTYQGYGLPCSELKIPNYSYTFSVNFHLFLALLNISNFRHGCFLQIPEEDLNKTGEETIANIALDSMSYLSLISPDGKHRAYFSESFEN